MKKVLITLLSLACFAGGRFANAGTHVWSGAQDGLWSNSANWSSGGAPYPAEAAPVVIQFPYSATARRQSTNNIGNLKVDVLAFYAGNYELSGSGLAITLTGSQPPFPYPANLLSGGSAINTIDPSVNIVLSSNITVLVGTDATLQLGAQMSGPGGFSKSGRGSLTLNGTAPNTYAGRTEFRGDGGTLHLDKGDLFNAIAIPGDLIVGDADQNDFPVSVIYHRANQVADTANVFVGPNCAYALNGHPDAVGSLTLAKSWVSSSTLSGPVLPGQLTVFGDITVSNSPPNLPASISGALSLGGSMCTIDVGGYSVLHVNASVSNGGLTKTGTGTLRLAGASTFAGNATVSQGVLEVLHSGALGSSSGGTFVQSGATVRLGNVNVSGEHLHLNGGGYGPFIDPAPGALEAKTANAGWYGVVTLQSDSTISVADNVTLTLGGVITGPGGLTLLDLGTVQFAGSSANSYLGETFARGGLLLLGKSALVTAVPGPLFVGHANAAANYQYVPSTNAVRLLASQQLTPTAPVNMEVTGMLDLNGYSQTVGPLTMTGAVITNTVGTLILNGDVVGSTLFNNWPQIHGNISLGGGTRTFTSLTPGAIFLEGPVSDGVRPAGIIKMGPYGLWLSNPNNTYSGVTHVKEGWLSAHQPGCLGSSAAGTIVESNAELSIGLDFHGPVETLTLNDGSSLYSVGINSWDGNIVVNGNASIVVDTAANNESLDINGTIYGGGGVTFQVGGTLRFGGNQPNTYNGATTVLGSTVWNTLSTLELRKPNGVVAIPGPLIIGSSTNPPAHEVVRLFSSGQIADAVPVAVNASGLLDLNNQSDAIGSLAGNGLVKLGLSTLTVGVNNADAEFSGTISGFGASSLVKVGTGKWTLGGNSGQFLGTTKINSGTVKAHVWMPFSAVSVNPGATLLGDGTLGDVASLGGTIYNDEFWVHPITLKNLSLDSAATLHVDLVSPQATGLSRLSAVGSVNLGGAKLDVALKFASTVGAKFQIITNDGSDTVLGTFKDLDEGATFVRGTAQFQITYKGGTGNDVVLTHIANVAPPQISSIEPLGNGQKKITGTGWPGLTYTVEASTDLKAWISIGTAVAASPGGQLIFTDPNAPNFPHRFYRFLLP